MTAYTYDDLYVINYTDIVKGTITIPKASVITDILDITLIGKSLLDYGEIFDENVLHILENFACPQINPPIDGVITPDLSQANDEKPSSTPLLSHPTTGELWFNRTDNHLYVYGTGNVWLPVKLRSDIAANSGIIVHGEQIPLPAGITSYSQCSYFVSPQYLDETPNYVACYADANGVVYMRYRPSTSANMVDGLANYIIFGNLDNGPYYCKPPNVTATLVAVTSHYCPQITVTPTLTAAPVLTLTPTNTVTPSLTPTINVSATGTPVATPTSTSTITPTLTGTPVITPTPTPTLTLTPTVTPINYYSYQMTAGSYISYLDIPNYPQQTITYYGYFINNFDYLGNYPQIGSIAPNMFPYSPSPQAQILGSIGGIIPSSGVGLLPSIVFGIYSTVPISLSQNFFSKITFTDQFGIFRTYTSVTALFGNNSSQTFTWSWSSPAAQLFTDNITYPILIYP